MVHPHVTVYEAGLGARSITQLKLRDLVGRELFDSLEVAISDSCPQHPPVLYTFNRQYDRTTHPPRYLGGSFWLGYQPCDQLGEVSEAADAKDEDFD